MDNALDILLQANYAEHKPDGAQPWELAFDSDYWLYRKRFEQWPKEHYVSRFPLHIDLEVTNACNLKCPHCWRTNAISKKQFRKVGFMSEKLFKKCAEEGIKKGAVSIKFNYMGEPLLHPDIVEMVRYCRKLGYVDIMFNTNGVALTEGMSRGLIEAGLTKIFFSVDSVKAKTYNYLRKPAKLHETLRKIHRFIEIRNELGQALPMVRCSMVTMKENANEERGFIDYWKDTADIVSISSYDNPEGIDDQEERQIDVAERFPGQLWQRIMVWWDGSISAACGDFSGAHLMGDANTETLESVWHGEKWQALRDRAVKECK